MRPQRRQPVLIAGLMCVMFRSQTFGQDCELYLSNDYKGSPALALRVGESTNWRSGGAPLCDQTGSFRVLSPNAAIRITEPAPPSGYESIYIYSEQDMPAFVGTDQYCDRNLIVTCDLRGERPPQPAVFVPIDRANVRPERAGHLVPEAGRSFLVLRRAFFWENAEPLGCPHGPPGNIKIRVTDPAVENYTYEQIRDDPSLYLNLTRRTFSVPGPVSMWLNSCCCFLNDAYNEWTDGPWGAAYSNLGVVDWDAECNAEQLCKRGIVFEEGDQTSLDDPLGDPIVVDRRDRGVRLVKLRMFGWVELENVTGGVEPSLDVAEVYVYDDWDGRYPVDLSNEESCFPACAPSESQSCQEGRSAECYGNQCGFYPNCALPCCWEFREMRNGSPYKPYADWFAGYNAAPINATIGLFRGRYPTRTKTGQPLVMDKPMKIIVVDGTAVFDK